MATSVLPGGAIAVAIANGRANSSDWVALVPAAGAENQGVQWRYLNGSTTRPAIGLANATVRFVAPGTGTYNVRFFANDGWTKLATSQSITVGQPTPTVTAPTAVNPGGTFSVTIANGPGSVNDWVTLNAVGSGNSQYVSWKYLSGATTRPPVGLTSTTMTFTAPMTAGTYEVRFWANDNWISLATSAPITVLPAITTLRETLGLPRVANTSGFTSIGVAVID